MPRPPTLYEPFQQESWAIGVRKGNTVTYVFLKEFDSGKKFDALGDKYLAEEKRIFKELGYPFFF